ncbi:hypothetical protein MKC44_10365, partial [[Clostridium] innocuum]|nr:hypothetical protein [[Clostridium] innocuum]
SHQKIQYILQNIQKKTISFRKLPIYNKKPMSLRKGIGFCQQSGAGKLPAFLFEIPLTNRRLPATFVLLQKK